MKRVVYLKLLNQLRDEARALGVKVFLYKRPYNKKNRTSGRFTANRKTIQVFTYGRQNYLSILSVLAHEVRHAQHVNLGLYKDYYNYREYDNKEFRILLIKNPMKIKLPSLRLGLAAEHNCNDFAMKWLSDHGVDTSLSAETFFLYLKYPVENLSSYSLYNLIKFYREEFKKGL